MNLPLFAAALSALLAYGFAAYNALKEPQRAGGFAAAAVAVGLHALAMGLAFDAADGRLGLLLALSLVTWQTALLLTLLWRVDTLHPLRAVVYPLAAMGALAATVQTDNAAQAPHSWKILLHAALSIFAAGLLTLAAAQAVAVALLNRLLHEPARLAEALKLPSLQASEDWLFQLIGAGFFMLSLALLSGLIFVDDLFAQHLAHKTVFSIAAWSIFGALLLGKRRWGWRGKQATRWALYGYGALLLAYFGSKLVLEQLLGRHWS